MLVGLAKCGGTLGAIITCPLEVVKTRLQSSQEVRVVQVASTDGMTHKQITRTNVGLISALRNIVKTEGVSALFRGLGPNLVGVAPSRAIYFFAYSETKAFMNTRCQPESPVVHLSSAAFAGFTASTLTNPIWFVKTRLQLDRSTKEGKVSTGSIIKSVYQKEGVRGFYRGVTASYAGISETAIHFMIYEQIKLWLRDGKTDYDNKTLKDFLSFMGAAAISKSSASVIAYPHEVARTRLREGGHKYRGFFQTLRTVAQEEGARALYAGLGTHLVRQIPNTAILMVTYESIVYLLNS
ncbi:solute carrier family 25 member 36-like isoform X2 [Anneissia japonica]|uniref:solute carrier family 25 member 36-like isoform X2 n=1 Tax=Anneissia japonica TaxID=1529436 RepID=UPI00142587A1|nr:solute carrier family 25 member 36-like isoform X2 [Anneissia japonica]